MLLLVGTLIMDISAISKQYLLLVLFLFCKEIIGSKKKTSRDNFKLSECRRCKILTDSFNHWFDKTSRGKYEGGDAAWEEAKLKSYSRSEVRLVEIQEALCSDVKAHQDQCYTLAEEAEQVLEKWWFHGDPSSDLYTWLCIENLQHCCPTSHYGNACLPCPKDTDYKVCGEHGSCDGDGTRKGNGTCLCERGYEGKLCDECSTNFYSSEAGLCEKCHESCNGCSDGEAASCHACKAGWQLESGVCIDINECNNAVCKPNEYCTNTKGSYSCKECDLSCKTCMGEGPSNCISCESTKSLWFGTCIDYESQQHIINSAVTRLALYIGLLVITLFIFRNTKSVASISMLIIGVFIYYSEKSLKMSTIDIFLHLLQTSQW